MSDTPPQVLKKVNTALHTNFAKHFIFCITYVIIYAYTLAYSFAGSLSVHTKANVNIVRFCGGNMISVIINIGFGLIIAIAVIVGLSVGFCRQFSKPLVGLLSILSAIILVTLLYPLIFNTGILNGFVKTATGWFSAEFYSRPITDVESFQSAVADNYLRIFSGSAEGMIARMQNTLGGAEVMTIGAFFGKSIVDFIIQFSMWLVFYLIFKYFMYGVKYLLCKITQVVVFKSIDRILGLLWSLLWTYIVVVGIVLTTGEIVIVQFFPNFEPTLAEVISNAALFRIAHSSNILGSFLSTLLNMRLIQIA